MKILGLEITRAAAAASGAKSDSISLDTLLQRLEAAYETGAGVAVTPETAMQSPTVQAIVTRVTRSMSSLPLHVLKKSEDPSGRVRKERQPRHPVQRLLDRPNDWQSRVDYWNDQTSQVLRYGNFYAFKSRGATGPVRRLLPLHPGKVTVEQQSDWGLVYKVTDQQVGGYREFTADEIHHVRGPARNGSAGDSPVMDARDAIALEIAAAQFGGSFFGNGALPLIMFAYQSGFRGFGNATEEKDFLEKFQEKFSKRGRHRAMLLPQGLEGKPVDIQNDKAQFLETRKLQRNIIAGAFGMPPHIAGDLEPGTKGNVEHQSLEYVQAVVLPLARANEAAMERDLLTDEDRRAGIVIRFNLDGLLRGDFKSRQDGLKIQRENGVINPNEWREVEGLNPRAGGDEYWDQGPSGQMPRGTAADPEETPDPGEEDEDT